MGRVKTPQISYTDEREFMAYVSNEFYRMMYYIAGQYTLNPHDREDIVQDCLVNLLEKSDKLQGLDDKALKAYIYKTAKHASINFAKHRKVVDKHSAEWKEWMTGTSTLENSEPNLDDHMIRMEELLNLEAVWGELTERERKLLYGRYVDKLSNEDIAAQLGCVPDSVRVLLRRARRNAFERMSKL